MYKMKSKHEIKDVLPLVVLVVSLFSFCEALPPSNIENTNVLGSNNILNITAGTQTIFVSWGVSFPRVSVAWFSQQNESGLFVLDDATEATINDLMPCSQVNVIVNSQDAEKKSSYYGSTVTAGNVPPKVKELKISNITARTLALSWKRPAIPCEITAYNITYSGVAKWGPRTEHTGSATIGRGDANDAKSIAIDGLQPYTDYTVTIAAATEMGQGKCTSTNAVTLHDRSSTVRDLDLSTTSQSTISAKWNEPETINGEIMNYIVRWRAGTEEHQSRVPYPTHTLVGLVPCTEYTVQVAAITEAGEGDRAERKQWTISELPAIVAPQCEIDEKEKQTTVMWHEPTSACLITEYEIIWGSYKSNETERIDPSMQVSSTFNVTKEWSSSNVSTAIFTVCVRANIEGEKGDLTCCDRLANSVNMTHPTVNEIKISSITACTLALSWKRPDTTYEITAYNITYSGVAKWGPRTEHTGSATIGRGDANGTTSVVIDGLQPYTDYTVMISVATEMGQGTSTSMNAVTPQDRPSTVRDLDLSSSTPSTIFAKWNEPETINGEILNYIVRCSAGKEEHQSRVPYPIHTVVGLVPCTEYTVQVTAITEAGEGDRAEGKQMTIPELPSIVAPQCDFDDNEQQTTIKWNAPTSVCIITGYEISWGNYVKNTIQSIDPSSMHVSSTFNVTNNWTPYSNHTVCVRANIKEAKGEWACCDQSTLISHSVNLRDGTGTAFAIATIVIITVTFKLLRPN